MRPRTRKTSAFAICLLIAAKMTLLLVLETPMVSSQTQNVDETLAQAEAASGKAYLTLVKTERSGGDISGLAVKFNTDLEELAHARTLASGNLFRPPWAGGT